MAFVALAACLGAIGTAKLAAGGDAGAVASLPAAVPASAAPAISAQLGRDLAAYHVVGLGAANPAQSFRTRFARGAVTLSSASGATLSLRLSAIGRPGAMRQLAAVAPQAALAGVSYARPGLREWYANGPLGLEQGFTVSARPHGASGPLTLSIALGGSLRPALAFHGQAVRFTSGSTTLSYGGLRVFDASGRQLPARLALAHGRLTISVADRGARYPIRIDPYVQDGSVLLGSGEVGDGFFGLAVAISPDASTIIVGTPQSGTGIAYVFVPSGSGWAQQAALTLAKAPASAYFGDAVSLSSNGNIALIGAPNADEAAVFTRSGTTWTQSAAVVPRVSVTGFGTGVSISNAGTTLLIGDNGSDTASNYSSAFVYTKNGDGVWEVAATLSPAGEDSNGMTFNPMHVALSGDGSTALLGNGFDQAGAGSAWVFTGSGSSWSQQGGRLLGSGPIDAAEFGGSVALSVDGDTAAIGAPADHCNAGAAYIFVRSGSSWSQQGSKLIASSSPGTCPSGTGGGGPTFGDSVALSSDGNTALIGGGQPAVYSRSGSTWTAVQSSGIDGGLGAALSADGLTAVTTCPGCGSGIGQGSVYHWTAGAPVTVKPPTLTKLRLKHAKVKHGHAVVIEFTLSGAGDVVVNFERVGHKHGKPTLTLSGSATLSGAGGANSFAIKKLAGKWPAAGSYQLDVFTEAGSQHSATQKLGLTIN